MEDQKKSVIAFRHTAIAFAAMVLFMPALANAQVGTNGYANQFIDYPQATRQATVKSPTTIQGCDAGLIYQVDQYKCRSLLLVSQGGTIPDPPPPAPAWSGGGGSSGSSGQPYYSGPNGEKYSDPGGTQLCNSCNQYAGEANPSSGQSSGGGGGGGGGGCFTSQTKVRLFDGRMVSIAEIKIGDKVMRSDGVGYNTVKYVESLEAEWDLYSPDQSAPFATLNHPLEINGKLSMVNDPRVSKMYPWLKISKLFEPTNRRAPDGEVVYNLWLDGDHTYTVNGYGTHSIIGDGSALRVSVEQGHIDHAQAMHVMHHLQSHSWNMHLGSYVSNRVFGMINSRRLNRLIYPTLAGQKTLAYKLLTAGMYTVGVVSSLFVSTYRTTHENESMGVAMT